jgi:hypothetical protein
MFSFRLRLMHAALLLGAALPLTAQTSSSQASPSTNGTVLPLSPVRDTMAHHPWNWGAFFDGGTSAGVTPTSTYLSIGARLGKVMTGPSGPGFLRGQFEYSAEVTPWWQGRTATFERYNLTATNNPDVAAATGPYKTGGAYNGFSLTPIVLRWDMTGTRRILPFVQGAGGLIWTNHKFPPVGPLPLPGHPQTAPLDYLQCERGAHLECIAGRCQPRRERNSAIPDRL